MPDPTPQFEALRVLLWMGGPVVLGYAAWRLVLQRRDGGKELAARIARFSGRAAILGSATPLVVIVVWVAPISATSAALLPLVGLLVHASGTLVAWSWAGILREPRARHGAYILAGSMSNVLTFGGIAIVLLLAGPDDPHAEKALGVMAIYRLAEGPYYFLVVWPLAAAVSAPGPAASGSWLARFRRALRGPQLAIVAGIFAGGVLNLAGIPRPEAFTGVAEVLVRINVTLLGITVGLGLRPSAPLRHLKPCFAIASVKFIAMPVVGFGLAWLFGARGTTLQVITICSAMPTAFMAVLGAVLYRIDEELVGSLWLVTTLAMFVVVPALALVLPHLAAS